MRAPLLILTCGGTFDKSKFTRAGEFVCGSSQAGAILDATDADAQKFRIRGLMRKDSLDMDGGDRSAIVDVVRSCRETRIVVVHGTDTMELTARAVAGQIAQKTVVLTGAMRPAVFAGSDAQFNLGFAIGCALCQPAGVWVAMHGELFAAGQVRKNRRRMRFASAKKPSASA